MGGYRPGEIFVKLAGDRYHSKFDLFSLVKAPATFSRIMRRLLRESHDLDNCLDEVLAHTKELILKTAVYPPC